MAGESATLRDVDPLGSELIISTNAPQDVVLQAFKSAFFAQPKLLDHIKPTPMAHMRAQITWASVDDVPGAAAAARIVNVDMDRRFEDYRSWRHELGETVALEFDDVPEDVRFRLTLESKPTDAGVNVPNPWTMHTYAHEICSILRHRGYGVNGGESAETAGYKQPPNAPPGWPFGADRHYLPPATPSSAES